MGKLHLAVGIFLAFNVNLDFVTDFEVVVVAEFGSVDDTVGFEADVQDNFAVIDRHHFTLDHIVLFDGFERFRVEIFQTGFFFLGITVGLFGNLVPVEVRHSVSISVFDDVLFVGRFGGVFLNGRSVFLNYGSCVFCNIFHVLFDFLSLFRSIQ